MAMMRVHMRQVIIMMGREIRLRTATTHRGVEVSVVRVSSRGGGESNSKSHCSSFPPIRNSLKKQKPHTKV